MTNLWLKNFKKSSVQTVSYWEFKNSKANSIDPDEVAQFEPPHLDLLCLQIQLYSLLKLLVLVWQMQ